MGEPQRTTLESAATDGRGRFRGRPGINPHDRGAGVLMGERRRHMQTQQVRVAESI